MVADCKDNKALYYQSLGWRHELWDVLRYFRSLGKNKKLRDFWLQQLNETASLTVVDTDKKAKNCEIHGIVPLKEETSRLFFQYVNESKNQSDLLQGYLRTEEEALDFCNDLGVSVDKTSTKNLDHHQSSKSLVGAVTFLSTKIAHQFGLNIDSNPQYRCVWFKEKDLYVTARNLDGAIPSLVNPIVAWEIKEYWGGTKGGSKMSDAVYECLLVGRELREYEEKHKLKIHHVVFIDGKAQWGHRVSDFVRLVDLYNQGLIDHLIVGREVETRWASLLENILARKS